MTDTKPTRKAVWVARTRHGSTDGAAVYVFGTEIEAWRHAGHNGMEVLRVPHGENLLTWTADGDTEVQP